MRNPKPAPGERWAVFLDLDGTLFAEKHTVPIANREAIAAARAKGHLVFLNTGRSFAHLPEGLLEQVEADGIITGNGAMLQIHGVVHHEAALSEELVERIMEYVFRRRELWALFEGYHRTYAISRDPERRKAHQIPLQSPGDVKKIYPDDRIQVVAIGETVPQDFIHLFRDELSVIQSPTYADVSRKGNTKAAAMEMALTLAGIHPDHTIAIGDGANDRDMLLSAAVGVAMANAHPTLLEVADHVTLSNLDCGVAAAIHKFLL